MQEIELPDGTVLEFPPGMGDDEIRAAVQSYLGQQSGGDQPQTREQMVAEGIESGGDFGNYTRRFLQGGTAAIGLPGSADEALAGLSATAYPVAEAVGLVPEWDAGWQDRFDTALEIERGRLKKTEGLAGGAAEVGGALVAAMTPIGRMGGAIGNPLTAANMARGVAAGAGLGASYGFNTGEGGVENRLENVPVNAAIGAAGGAAGNVVQAGAGRLGRMLTDPNKMRAQQMGVSPETYRIARSAAEMGDVDVPGGGQAYIRQGGPDAMIGDVMPGQLDYVTNVGAGAPIARRNLNSRIDQASRDVARATNKTLGEARGKREITREIMDSTRANRKSAYDEAFNTPIDYNAPGGLEIEDILQRIDPDTLRAAMKKAEAELRNMKAPNRQFKINILDNGDVVVDELPNVLQMDQLKRALDDIARAGTSKVEGTISSEARLASQHAKEISQALAANNKNYAEALKAGKDAITQREGRQIGAKLLDNQTYVEDIAEIMQRTEWPDWQRMKQGLRSEMAHRLGNVRRVRSDPNTDQRAAWQNIADVMTDNNQEKLRLLLGNVEAQQYFDELETAARAFGVRAKAADNSATAGRQTMDRQVTEAAGRGRIPDRPVASIVDAVGSVPARVGNAMTGRTQGQIMNRQQAVQRELAELITGLRGEDAVRAFQQLLSQQRPAVNYQGPFSRRLAAGSRLAAPPAVAPLLQP